MASAQVSVVGRTGQTFPSLDAWLEHVAKVDIPAILPAVALAELNTQKAGGNPPSNILVDGKPSNELGIASATRRVQLFFLDVEILARAVTIAFEELRRLYTRKTGRSAATIQVWGRSLRGGTIRHERLGGIGAVRDYLASHRNPGTYIRLIGPDVPNRRALYYSPPGGKATFQNINRLSDKRLGELERGGARGRIVTGKKAHKGGRKRKLIQIESTQTVSDIVTKHLGAIYGKSIYINARWLQVPVPPWRGVEKRRQGVPTVALGWKLRGAVGGT
jgi:hypothetical protein